MSRAPLVLLLLLGACREDRRHVFQEPPPARAPQPAPVAAPAEPPAEFGSRGAAAEIKAVQAVSTGAPVALGSVDAAFSVLVLAARGPGWWNPDANARLELVITGPRSATYTRPLETPAPALVAHQFTVTTQREDANGLPPGNYQMRARLVMRGTSALAESLPLHFSVR